MRLNSIFGTKKVRLAKPIALAYTGVHCLFNRIPITLINIYKVVLRYEYHVSRLKSEAGKYDLAI